MTKDKLNGKAPITGNKVRTALSLTQRLLTRAIDAWEPDDTDAAQFLNAWNDLQTHVQEVTAQLTRALRMSREEREQKEGG